ncbi:MAG: tripartite tricarboxylate transporter substrate binding protein [Betaproteobacteria bacterium]
MRSLLTALTHPLKHAGLALALLSAAAAAQAQAFPTKPITIIVSFAPGGSVDALTRIVAQHMSKTLGQAVVLENVAGAGGTIGSARVARAAADGYLLVAGSSGSHAGAYSAYEKMPYTTDSFANLGITAILPALVVVKKDLPVKNLQELIAYGKANPGKLSFGHPGVGSSVHLQCEFLKLATGVDLRMVPYKGAGALMTDLLGGHIDGGCDAPPSSSGPVQAGQIRAIAVMGAERAAAMPTVATTVEQGLPELQAPAWIGLFAPKAIPPAVLDRLEKAVSAALDDADVQARITKLGANVPAANQRGVRGADKFIQDEIRKWAELAKAAQIVKQ